MTDPAAALEICLTCRCDPAWTERRLHAPDCRSEYLDDLHRLIGERDLARAAGFAEAIALLRECDDNGMGKVYAGFLAEHQPTTEETP